MNLLIANLTTKLAGNGADAWTPPDFTFGEALTLSLRFAEDVAGETIEPSLDIVELTASLGGKDLRPDSGTFHLQIGSGGSTLANTTEVLQHDCSAQAMATAINALGAVVATHGAATVKKAKGSWFIQFGAGADEVPMQLRHNELVPLSAGEVLASAVDQVWKHEVRLIQLPPAFTDVSERVLPPPPKITPITNGSDDGVFVVNEVQALYIPPEFRGVFALKFGNAKTGLLSRDDNAETVQAALIAARGANFAVTLIADDTLHIEFINALGGVNQEEIEVILPDEQPVGDLTFTLEFDKAELWDRLREFPSVTLPLEVWIKVDEGEHTRDRVAFRQNLTILKPVRWPSLATVPRTDWLRAASPVSYVPHGAGVVITGEQQYTVPFGDGAALEFRFSHGLETDIIASVLVRENVDDGRVLLPTEYEVRITDEDEVKVIFAEGTTPPAADSLAVTIKAALTTEALTAHTHEIGDINGLQEIIDRLEALEDAFEDLIPTVNPSLPASEAAKVLTLPLDSVSEIFPGPGNASRGRGLVPAIHTATVLNASALATPLPAASGFAGNLYTNNTAGAFGLPGGLGRPPVSVPVSGLFASDGRAWYQVTKRGTSKSYFPTDYEREIKRVFIDQYQLLAGGKLVCEFDETLAILRATTSAQIMVVVQVGAAPSATSPATTATNLQDITWIEAPLLEFRAILTGQKVKHHLGIAINRDIDGTTMTASKLIQNGWNAGAQAPAGANFALRWMLRDFDTEGSVAKPSGVISHEFASTGIIITNP